MSLYKASDLNADPKSICLVNEDVLVDVKLNLVDGSQLRQCRIQVYDTLGEDWLSAEDGCALKGCTVTVIPDPNAPVEPVVEEPVVAVIAPEEILAEAAADDSEESAPAPAPKKSKSKKS